MLLEIENVDNKEEEDRDSSSCGGDDYFVPVEPNPLSLLSDGNRFAKSSYT